MTEDGHNTAARSRYGRHRLIGALGIAQIFSYGASYYLPTILARPTAAETGWPYAWVVAGFSLGVLVGGVVAVRVGHAIQRRGGRPVMAAAALVMAAGLVVMAMAPTLAVYLVAWVVIGIGMAGGLYDATFSTLGRIFGAEARRAITTLTLWGGFASTVCWPISTALVERVGWRMTSLAYAAILILIVLPLYLFMLPDEERSDSIGTADKGKDAPGETPETRRVLTFAILALVLTIGSTVTALWSVHLITVLEAGGRSLAAAVALGALIGPAQVGGRVVEMSAGGRHHPLWTLTASAVLVAIGFGLLWMGFPWPALALIAFGAGNGIFSIARGTVPLALFGSSGYAVVMGRLAMPSLIAQAAAPTVGALVLDRFEADGLLLMLTGLALANVAAVILLWRCSRGAA